MKSSILAPSTAALLETTSARLEEACNVQSKLIVEADNQLAELLCRAGMARPLPELVVQQSNPKIVMSVRYAGGGWRVGVDIRSDNPNNLNQQSLLLTDLDVELSSKVLPRLDEYACLLAQAMRKVAEQVEEQIR